MNKLKIFFLTLITAVTLNTVVTAQKLNFPTDVRYIAGGYINKAPYFKTLQAALNDVKAFATSSRPYTFWLDSDTTKIADWDSIYTGSLLSMRDSIDAYYVAAGKIKWAGFGAGGGLSGGTGIGGTTAWIIPDYSTTHYNFPTWDPGAGHGAAYDSGYVKDRDVDQAIYDLIVYTDSTGSCLYIQTDSLRINLGCMVTKLQALGISGWNPDTTTIVRTTGNQNISGVKTILGSLEASSNGFFRLGTYNPVTGGTTRALWSSTDSVFFSADGITNKTLAFVNQVKALLVPYLLAADTLSLSNRINLKLNITDTTNVRVHSDNKYLWADSLIYGTMGFADSAFVILSSQNIWYPITNTWNNLWTDGITTAGLTWTGDSVQVAVIGEYEIDWDLSFRGANTDDYKIAIFVDNVKQSLTGEAHRDMTGTTIGSASAHTILSLGASSWISLRIMNTANANDPTAVAGNFVIKRVNK